jgi:3-methylfumaryl-CoA hydratase
MDLKDWIGRTETTTDVAEPGVYHRLAGVLDHKIPPWRAGAAPPLGHWLNFLPDVPQSDIGEDGHPKRGGFLPPVSLPRRMWAGSRLTFSGPILIGAKIDRRSTIQSVEPKSGRSGEMVFVTVRHEVFARGAVCVSEEQDIVYREAPKPSAAASPPAPPEPGLKPEWSRRITPDPISLFRYSALTYNGHRIHYDRDYCRDVEGYPGLVVHGPLIATLLLDHYLRRHPGAAIAGFSFRAQSPLYDTAPFDLNGRETADGAQLWAMAADGQVAMKAAVRSAIDA